jgi:glucose-1-phosphate cytidylyltransferase
MDLSKVPAVILAGGFGTRLAEETHLIPKPMVTIGGKPILWHIMKMYSHYGVSEFIVACGYKGYVIKEYFAQYALHNADVVVDLADQSMTFLERRAEPWRVSLIDTGEATMTGGRLGRLRGLLPQTFFATYGDGVSDVSIGTLWDHHRQAGRKATVTVTAPVGRFGQVRIDQDAVSEFTEKPVNGTGYINGGFFVLEHEVLDLIDGDETVLEQDVLPALADQRQLTAFHHDGFWRPMDTLRDREDLEALWQGGRAPWAVWRR